MAYGGVYFLPKNMVLVLIEALEDAVYENEKIFADPKSSEDEKAKSLFFNVQAKEMLLTFKEGGE